MTKKIIILGSILVIAVFVLFLGGRTHEDRKREASLQQDENGEISADLEQRVLSFTMDGRSPKGVKQWHLEGSSAEIVEDDIYLKDLSAIAYGENVTIYLTSKNGIYNRGKGEVELMGNVVVVSDDGFSLTTEKAKWSQNTKDIFTDSVINIEREALIAKGEGGKANSEMGTATLYKNVTVKMEPDTIIYCDGPLEIDYNKKVASFYNNVQVKDKEGKLFSDRLIVEFDPETEKFKQVTAEGNVKTKKGNSWTLSEEAVYTGSTKSIKLLGRPKIVIDPQELSDFDKFGE